MTWLRNLYEPLCDLGHDVHLLRIDLVENALGGRQTADFRSTFSEKLLTEFKHEHKKRPFDFFLSYFRDSDVDPSCIDEISRAGVPTANFSCNNVHQFYLTRQIAPHFDYNLHSEADAGEKFKKLGANPIWFPMAANPKYYRPLDLEKTLDVSFIGGGYAKRPFYIWALLQNNLDIHVFGPNWKAPEKAGRILRAKLELYRIALLARLAVMADPSERARLSSQLADIDFRFKLASVFPNNIHHPVSDDEMIRTYNQSKISLGFLEVYENHDSSVKSLQHIHLREFEVPMCRTLYFTNYSDELTAFYEPDKEVVVFRNEYELMDKLKYFLANPEEAEKIRVSGYKRALGCHTCQRRIHSLLDSIGLH
jgi:spore maturation protein CgeB